MRIYENQTASVCCTSEEVIGSVTDTDMPQQTCERLCRTVETDHYQLVELSCNAEKMWKNPPMKT